MPEKITKKSIDALRSEAVAQQKTRYLFDSEFRGFGAVATKTGTCSYFVEYRLRALAGPETRTLGKHGALTPDEARKLAKEELGKVAAGTDVAQERKDARAKLKAGTFRICRKAISWPTASGKRQGSSTCQIVIPAHAFGAVITVNEHDIEWFTNRRITDPIRPKNNSKRGSLLANRAAITGTSGC